LRRAPRSRKSIWLDLLEPTPSEEKQVESFPSIDVPTRDEMREIESSNRLYEEDGALYMTATVVTKLDSDLPESTQITFILSAPSWSRTATWIRCRSAASSPTPSGIPNSCNSPPAVLGRPGRSRSSTASPTSSSAWPRTWTRLGRGLQRLAPQARRVRDFRKRAGAPGQNGELISKARESLVSLGRLLTFVQQSTSVPMSQEVRARFRTLSRDVMAMSDHASFLGTKVSFILDATLGLINIDQNNILKIFSVVTVFLLPPVGHRRGFGMNFSKMPWLPRALGVLGGHGPDAGLGHRALRLFKRKGWL
jgi:magnesium transporter